MSSSKKIYGWFILCTGFISLTWTILLHGQLYGYSALPRAGSTITLLAATVFTIFIALFVNNMGKSKKTTLVKLNMFLLKNPWLVLAVFTPFFLFGFVFLLSSHSLRPLPAFIRQVSLPYLIFLFVLLLLWIGITIFTLVSRIRINPLQDSRLVINRVTLHRGLWNLFIFLALANALGSIIIAVTQNTTFYSTLCARFLVENEASIYTYVSGFLLLAISIGFGIQGHLARIKSLRLTWSLLSVLFLVLSIDEIISIHEVIIASLRFTGLELTASAFAYLLPIAVSAVFVIYLVIRSFIRHRVQNWWLFFAGCVVFIIGSVFIESITEAMEIYYGEGFVPLLLLKSMLFIEEAMELTGTYMILFFILDLFFGKYGKISLGWKQIPDEEVSAN
jgi:hypothetical protein